MTLLCSETELICGWGWVLVFANTDIFIPQHSLKGVWTESLGPFWGHFSLGLYNIFLVHNIARLPRALLCFIARFLDILASSDRKSTNALREKSIEMLVLPQCFPLFLRCWPYKFWIDCFQRPLNSWFFKFSTC